MCITSFNGMIITQRPTKLGGGYAKPGRHAPALVEYSNGQDVVIVHGVAIAVLMKDTEGLPPRSRAVLPRNQHPETAERECHRM
jgi:hypothetical protein